MNVRPRPNAGLLAVPVLLLAAIVALSIWLRATAPVVDDDLRIDGLEELALDGELEPCVRDAEGGSRSDEIRARIGPGARTTSAQVLACPMAYDQLTVTLVGELVGHLLERDGGAWVQLNDDAYALELGPLPAHGVGAGFNSGFPVWLPSTQAAAVGELGGPGRRGDVVRVRGVVERTDEADGGGITLRASDLEVVAPSVPLEEPLHVPQAVAAGVAAIAAGVTASVLRARRRHER